jgi:hypothetical protein
MLGDTGLPTISSRITLNGFHTTIAGNNSTLPHPHGHQFRKLTLRGLTITGGNTPGPGGDIFNLEGTPTGGGIFAVPGSPVTLKVTVVAKNIPDNCAPPGTIPGYKG